MTPWEEKRVDACILESSRLKPASKEYESIRTLMEEGNLLYCFLGKWETLELTKILISLQFRYEYVTGGIQLRPESKEDFYRNIMNRRAAEPAGYYGKQPMPLGKAERHDEGSLGWAEQILANRKADK